MARAATPTSATCECCNTLFGDDDGDDGEDDDGEDDDDEDDEDPKRSRAVTIASHAPAAPSDSLISSSPPDPECDPDFDLEAEEEEVALALVAFESSPPPRRWWLLLLLLLPMLLVLSFLLRVPAANVHTAPQPHSCSR